MSKGKFTKDVRALMYGFGDDVNPLNESVEVMEELLDWFILDLCDSASKKCPAPKLKTAV